MGVFRYTSIVLGGISIYAYRYQEKLRYIADFDELQDHSLGFFPEESVINLRGFVSKICFDSKGRRCAG